MKDLLKALRGEEREEYVTAPVVEPSVDWNAIEEFEGGRQRQGYVPASGKSGVTLSSGLDVGQRNSLEGLPESVQRKAEPFLGLKRDEAQSALAAQGGIRLSPEEANQVAQFAQNETLDKVKNYWKEASNIPFESLTPAQQTVLASVAYQYGGLNRTPRFSREAAAGKWENVLKELRNFGDEYKSRRNKEADYLESDLRKKVSYNND